MNGAALPRAGFGTIRNNTALKRVNYMPDIDDGFGTIRNNTALKQLQDDNIGIWGFGTIRNNTALKHSVRALER